MSPGLQAAGRHVSSNDLLMWWEQAPATQLAILYVESFGSPRKFARAVDARIRVRPAQPRDPFLRQLR
jgi:hypothetical protein